MKGTKVFKTDQQLLAVVAVFVGMSQAASLSSHGAIEQQIEEEYPIQLDLGEIDKVPMGALKAVELRLSGYSSTNVRLHLNLSNPENEALSLLNTTFIFTPLEIRKSTTKTLFIEAHIIGINSIQFWLDTNWGKGPAWSNKDDIQQTGDDFVLLRSEDVSVIIANSALNQIFMIVMTLMVIINTVNMGAQLDLEIIKAVFRRPIGPVVGFLAQFVFMPLISFLVGWLCTDDALFRLGLFVLGCSPGGNGSNFWTLLLEGDINLSITMTFVSTVAALGMMPLWIFLMGPLLTDDNLVIPFGQLIFSLIGLIIPLAFGMWIRWRWTRAAKIMEKIIVPFTLLTVLFILTAGVYINLFIFMLITPLMVAAGFAVAISGYLFGAGLAWVFGLSMPQITAVSIETSFQNGGIAFVLLKMSFPEPLGELASVAPVAQLMITGLPLWALLAILKIYKKCRGNDVKPAEDTKEKAEIKRDDYKLVDATEKR